MYTKFKVKLPKLFWIILVLLIPSLLVNAYFVSHFNTSQGARVILVTDGDTFVTEDKSIIRFDTLDAPELANCGGPEAKAALEKIILNQKVHLDTQARDVNGRQVASVWIGNTWVDEQLLKTGWVAYSSSTVDTKHVLQNIDRFNKANNIGIYNKTCTQFTNPDNPKCNIKGNIVGEWNNRGDKVYHLPGCKQYSTTRIEKWRGEQWFCSEKDALKSGYTKSGGC